MGDVCFTLLGPPEVRHADQVLLFSTHKELALLIYLAVEGRVHLRQNLSEQFWPEGDARHGRAALRLTVLHLRHLLGEGEGFDAVPHLRITRDTLGLDLTSGIELDLHPLHEAWTLARTSTRSTLTMSEDARRSLLAQLQRATSLPRGEFLLLVCRTLLALPVGQQTDLFRTDLGATQPLEHGARRSIRPRTPRQPSCFL